MQSCRDIRFRLIVAFYILLGCLMPQTSWAFSLKSDDGIRAAVSLSGHLAVYYDPTGTLTINDVTAERPDVQFTPIPSMLVEGYRIGAIWVRFSLSAPEDTGRWLLQIERPLVEQAVLYSPDGTGHFTASPAADPDATTEGDARAYPALFAISVSPASSDHFLRLQSSTSITTVLNIWQKEGYERYLKTDDWIIGIVIGAIGAMIVANILYAIRLKDSLYLLYAGLLLLSGLVPVFHMGYASEFFHGLRPQWLYRGWGAIVCLYSMVMVLFLGRLFEFRRHWTWAWRIAQAIALLNGIALLFALAGRYGDVAFFVSRLQQLSFIFIALLVLHLLVIRRQYQYLLSAIAFGTVVVISLVMQMQYTGSNPFQIDSSLARLMAVGTLTHLVLLSAAVATRARLAERRLWAVQERVIAISQAAERDLIIKVRERTAELSNANASLREEVDRRHILETKLRQSLDSVNDALSQQRDFLAIVTHEFRGPLAVIAATTDNLASRAAEADDAFRRRIARIRLTVGRMLALIENVLASDRLNANGKIQAAIERLDLNQIAWASKTALDDDTAGRIAVVSSSRALVSGDRYLLEIAVQNLVQNALKYSVAPSRVTIEISSFQGMAALKVTDRGTGILPDNQASIFLKYYRAPNQRVNGSGLGLYIAREIARQHGGDLTLAASDANGSTFCLALPLAS